MDRTLHTLPSLLTGIKKGKYETATPPSAAPGCGESTTVAPSRRPTYTTPKTTTTPPLSIMPKLPR